MNGHPLISHTGAFVERLGISVANCWVDPWVSPLALWVATGSYHKLFICIRMIKHTVSWRIFLCKGRGQILEFRRVHINLGLTNPGWLIKGRALQKLWFWSNLLLKWHSQCSIAQFFFNMNICGFNILHDLHCLVGRFKSFMFSTLGWWSQVANIFSCNRNKTRNYCARYCYEPYNVRPTSYKLVYKPQ